MRTGPFMVNVRPRRVGGIAVGGGGGGVRLAILQSRLMGGAAVSLVCGFAGKRGFFAIHLVV